MNTRRWILQKRHNRSVIDQPVYWSRPIADARVAFTCGREFWFGIGGEIRIKGEGTFTIEHIVLLHIIPHRNKKQSFKSGS